jgi:negative regulator of sigma E activity
MKRKWDWLNPVSMVAVAALVSLAALAFVSSVARAATQVDRPGPAVGKTASVLAKAHHRK